MCLTELPTVSTLGVRQRRVPCGQEERGGNDEDPGVHLDVITFRQSKTNSNPLITCTVITMLF